MLLAWLVHKTGRLMMPYKGLEVAGLTETVTLKQVVVLQEPSALAQYVVVTVGVTFTDAPEISYVPPQDTEYQLKLDPETREPPVSASVLELPEQSIAGVAVTTVGAILLIVIVMLKHVVVLQEPCALTQ